MGTPDGHTIPQNVAQIAVNLINVNMSTQTSIDSPKVAFFEEEKVVITESKIPVSTLNKLKKKGHHIDNEHLASYIGLSGKIGNAIGVKIISNQKNNFTFDVGSYRRKDGWSITHLAIKEK